MQNEIACHVGMKGNLFCRMCYTSKGYDDEDDPPGPGLGTRHANQQGSGAGSDGSISYGGLSAASTTAAEEGEVWVRDNGRDGRTHQAVHGRCFCSGCSTSICGAVVLTRHPQINASRTRQDTINFLKSQFVTAQRVGGQEEYKRVRLSCCMTLSCVCLSW